MSLLLCCAEPELIPAKVCPTAAEITAAGAPECIFIATVDGTFACHELCDYPSVASGTACRDPLSTQWDNLVGGSPSGDFIVGARCVIMTEQQAIDRGWTLPGAYWSVTAEARGYVGGEPFCQYISMNAYRPRLEDEFWPPSVVYEKFISGCGGNPACGAVPMQCPSKVAVS